MAECTLSVADAWIRADKIRKFWVCVIAYAIMMAALLLLIFSHASANRSTWFVIGGIIIASGLFIFGKILISQHIIRKHWGITVADDYVGVIFGGVMGTKYFLFVGEELPVRIKKHKKGKYWLISGQLPKKTAKVPVMAFPGLLGFVSEAEQKIGKGKIQYITETV